MADWTSEPWAPLFADVAPAERACWSREVRVEAPLAIPPPWAGTATMTIPAGCGSLIELRSNGTFWRYSLDLGDAPFVITLTVRRGDALVSQRRHTSSNIEFDRRGQLGLVNGGSVMWVTLGDALPWVSPGRDMDGYFAELAYESSFCELGIPLDELLWATGRTPYAGLGINLAASADHGPELNIPPQPDFGSTTPDRRAALKAVDPAQLNPWQRRMRETLMRQAPRRPRPPTCPIWTDEPLLPAPN